MQFRFSISIRENCANSAGLMYALQEGNHRLRRHLVAFSRSDNYSAVVVCAAYEEAKGAGNFFFGCKLFQNAGNLVAVLES